MSAYANNVIEACVGKHWNKKRTSPKGRVCRTKGCKHILSIYNHARHCNECLLKHRVEFDGDTDKLQWKDMEVLK